jgi:glycosyltransferase involved in cell wall biosynthesis
MRVVQLTSAHPRDDIRIFYKECRSLVTAGYDVTLVVADGLGDGMREGVRILDVGCDQGRLRRMLKTTSRVFAKAVGLDAHLYHLHDPELIPVGLRLKRLGKRVVFDSHEDFPKQLLGKPYLSPFALNVLSKGFSIFERQAGARFDGIIGATPTIREKFLTINPNTVDVDNYPILGELDATLPWSAKSPEVCYVGSIAGIRGIREIVRAMELIGGGATLSLVGAFAEPDVEAEVKGYGGWQRVNALGVQDRQGVRETLGRSVAGLVTLHPVVNYLDALPIKMFEYMAAGIPVIASNFPLWREIVEGNRCGICVDPLNPREIAAAIESLIHDRVLAEEMGANGARAVRDHFNWGAEEQKLLAFYGRIFAGT